jgi:hypothetical protein
VTAVAARARGFRVPSLGPLLELIGLAGLAVAQPLFDVFDGGADIFVAYGAVRIDVVLFALAVVLLVPLVLFAAELLAGLLGERARRAVHLASVFVLVAALVSQTLKRETDLGRTAVALLAVAAAAVLVLALSRWEAPRLFLRFLAVAPAIFALLFLFSSPITPLVTSSGSVAAADVEVGDPAPVVMVVFDELPLASLLGPNDHIDPSLFPNFASLADDGTWYRDDTTVAGFTPQAVPALLTGQYPEDEDTLPVAASHEENLFTLLGDDYHLHASEGWTRLCPPNLCEQTGTAEGAALPRLINQAGELWWERASPDRATVSRKDRWETSRRRRQQVEEFIDGLDSDDGGRPRLDFLHVLLPHVAYEYLPTGQRYTAPPFPAGDFFGAWLDEDVASAARQRHLLQLMYTDRLLGQVLDRLRQLDRYDESLVVVTADHGAGFVPGSPLREISEDNLHEVAWTPLIIKSPHQTSGGLDDTPVRSIDVLPTIADVLGVDLPWRVDGRAIRPGRADEGPDRIFLHEADRLRPDDGPFATFDRAAEFDRMLAVPPGNASGDDLGVFRQGRYGDLVGRDVDDLDVGEVVTAPGALDHRDAYRDVELDAPRLPVYVSGDVTPDGPDPALAVAVNGVIGGWAHGYLPTFLAPGLDPRYTETPRLRRWWTMVPPALLRDGDNDIELFRIDGDPGSVELRPIRFRPD